MSFKNISKLQSKLKNLCKSRWLLYIILIALVLWGCQTLRYYVVKHKGLAFNHKRHLQEGLDCDACHTEYSKGIDAGMPSFDDCKSCHSDEEENKKPKEKQIVNFLIDGKPVWSKVTDIDEEIKFSHKTHFDAKISCEICHKGIKESNVVSSQLAMKMADCSKCHTEIATEKNMLEFVPDNCLTCHSKVTKEAIPNSHDKLFRKFHGQILKTGKGVRTQDQCSLCHEEETCAKCHQDSLPESHNNFWRYEGHGINARTDRRGCITCHRVDYCQRCHQETAPRNHIGLWAGSGKAGNQHCLSCHFPTNSQVQNCNVCHKSIMHSGAPDKPSTPVHATNNPAECRFCHTASLQHPDNLVVHCNNCHK